MKPCRFWILVFILNSLIPFSIQDIIQNQTNNANTSLFDYPVTMEPDVVKQWKDNIDRFKGLVNYLLKMVLPVALSSSSEVQISPQCTRALLQFALGLKNLKPWALYMLDASAKAIDGVLTGSMSSFGSYDQCLDIIAMEEKRFRAPKELFRGQYCTLEYKPPLPPKPRLYSLDKRLDAFAAFENDTGVLNILTKHVQLFYFLSLRMGICVPSACSIEDLKSIVETAGKKTLHSDVTITRCEVKEPNVVENFQIPVIIIFALLLLIVTVGTCVDIYFIVNKKRFKNQIQVNSTKVQVLRSFSAYTNFMHLINPDSASESLKSLHGIRFYSICWVILGHTYYHLNLAMLRHLEISIELSTQIAFNIISNATYVVDNFFFISGLLMTYVSLNLIKETQGKFSIPLFIVHRIWRLWPIHMAFVGFTMLLPWFGSGPLWHETIDKMVDSCRRDWWTNMIFINNIYRSGLQGCVSHAWYLAADLQIYVFSLVVLVPLIRRPKLGIIINSILIVASVFAIGLFNYFNELPPTMMFNNPDPGQNAQLRLQTYYPPHQHLAPFCIGIFIGYYLQKRRLTTRIHPIIQLVAWPLTVIVTSAVLFGPHSWSNGNDPGTIATVLYAALSRVGWTLGIAWITVACSTGYGGILNSMLCWKPLIPLSRLTFLVYMVHPFIQHIFHANLRESVQAKNYPAVFLYFGNIMASYGISVMLCLVLESPWLSLGKILFDRRRIQEKEAAQVKERISGLQRFAKRTIVEEEIFPKLHLRNGKSFVSDMDITTQKNHRSNEAVDINGINNGGFIHHL